MRGPPDARWDADGWRTWLAGSYALCLLVSLIDLDNEKGFTRFWPGSHRSRGLAGSGAVAEMTGATWDGECQAGDAGCYDYWLMHRGLRNSSRVLRPVLQVLIRKSWYEERRNYETVSLREPIQ